MKKVAKKLIILIVVFNMLINSLFVNISFAAPSTVDYLTPRKRGGLSEEQRLNIVNACNFFITNENSKNRGTVRFPLIYCVSSAGWTDKYMGHLPNSPICKGCVKEKEAPLQGDEIKEELGYMNERTSKFAKWGDVWYYNDPVVKIADNENLKDYPGFGGHEGKLYFTYCNHYAFIVYKMILGSKIGALENVTKPVSYIAGGYTNKEGEIANEVRPDSPIEYIPIYDTELADNGYPDCTADIEEAKQMDPTKPDSKVRIYPGDVLVTNYHVQIYLGENVAPISVENYEVGTKYKGHASGHGNNVLISKFDWDAIMNSKDPERGEFTYCGIVRVREGKGEELENIDYATAIRDLGFQHEVDTNIEKYRENEITEIIYDEDVISRYNVLPKGEQVDPTKDKFKFSFSAVIDKILGIMFLIPKVIVIGYTGLMQKFVVADLVNAITGTSLVGNLTVEKIVFNEVPLLDINFFNITPELYEEQPVIYIIRDNIKSWYNGIRYLGIAGMLIVLVYIGIRIAITSIAEEKGKYKAMLKDWLISFLMLFVIHYIMIGVITLNEAIIGFFTKGGANESSLFDQILVRAYDLRLSVGLPATIMYVILVVFTILYLFAYLKRFFTVAILTIFAPIVAVSYAIDKVKDGKSQTYGLWLREYIYNVLIQSVHVLIYTVFIGTSIQMALSGMTVNEAGEVIEVTDVWNALIANMVPALVFMLVSLRLDKLFKSIFTFSNSKTQDDIPSSFEEIASAAYVVKNTSMGLLKTGGKIAAAPVTLPFKAASRALDKFDFRPDYVRTTSPTAIRKAGQYTKNALGSVSEGAKGFANALKQVFPENLGELNSFMMLNKIYDLAKKRKTIKRSKKRRISD